MTENPSISDIVTLLEKKLLSTERSSLASFIDANEFLKNDIAHQIAFHLQMNLINTFNLEMEKFDVNTFDLESAIETNNHLRWLLSKKEKIKKKDIRNLSFGLTLALRIKRKNAIDIALKEFDIDFPLNNVIKHKFVEQLPLNEDVFPLLTKGMNQVDKDEYYQKVYELLLTHHSVDVIEYTVIHQYLEEMDTELSDLKNTLIKP